MNIYYYDPMTLEYLGYREARIDPLETKIQGKDVYLLPATATFKEILPSRDGYAQRFVNNEWEYIEDQRKGIYYDPETGAEIIITELGEKIPVGYPTEAPPTDMFNPRWNETEWIETAIVYQGQKVTTKAAVDAITKQRIIDLGEEKAKTEKLIAGTGTCAIWDSFVAARAAIIEEGNAFITTNNLI